MNYEWRRFELCFSGPEKDELYALLDRLNLSRRELALIVMGLRVRPEFELKDFGDERHGKGAAYLLNGNVLQSVFVKHIARRLSRRKSVRRRNGRILAVSRVNCRARNKARKHDRHKRNYRYYIKFFGKIESRPKFSHTFTLR